MKISAVMIVKNEEACLAKCLGSIYKFVDEIVILDTGSTDSTIEIAQGYTDNVYLWAWEDNFAEARNVAILNATGDIILSIDADEVLVPSITKKALIKQIQKHTKNISGVRGADVLMDNGSGATGRFPRIFKREGAYWEGAIHEYPVLTESVIDVTDSIKIVYGTSESHKVDPDFDFRLLEKEYNKGEATARTCFYFGRELWYREEYQCAIDMLAEGISKDAYYMQITEAMRIIAQCHWMLQQGPKARERLMMCVLRNPHMKKAILSLADMSWDREKARWQEFAKKADNSQVLFT